jgi:hypothetical protein
MAWSASELHAVLMVKYACPDTKPETTRPSISHIVLAQHACPRKLPRPAEGDRRLSPTSIGILTDA